MSGREASTTGRRWSTRAYPRTATHEPEDVDEDGCELDGGYGESDPLPAMELHGLSDAVPILVGEFVPPALD